MAGLILNSYPLRLHGKVKLHEIRNARKNHARDELRALAGVAVWVGETDAFAFEKPAAAVGEVQVIDKDLAAADSLSLWAARAGIVAHCRTLDYDAWFGRYGEIHLIGPIAATTEDRFQIQHGIIMRVSREDYIEADAILTVRPRTRWLCRDSLADADVAAHASGRHAIRIAGDGPRRGWIRAVNGDDLLLEAGENEITVRATDYTLSVNAAIIASWRGSAVLRAVRVNTGDLTTSGKRNRHGVEDRFRHVGKAVRKLGATIVLPGEGKISIAPCPVAIRLEDR